MSGTIWNPDGTPDLGNAESLAIGAFGTSGDTIGFTNPQTTVRGTVATEEPFGGGNSDGTITGDWFYSGSLGTQGNVKVEGSITQNASFVESAAASEQSLAAAANALTPTQTESQTSGVTVSGIAGGGTSVVDFANGVDITNSSQNITIDASSSNDFFVLQVQDGFTITNGEIVIEGVPNDHVIWDINGELSLHTPTTGRGVFLVNGAVDMSGGTLDGQLFFTGSGKFTSAAQVNFAPCYAAGTQILTARGEVPVEKLGVGDLVVTLSGRGSPLKPVRWIGERRVDVAGHLQPDLVRPVRIRAGAFGKGMPQRDLLVSPDHALVVDRVLVNAGKLVNGITILQDLSTSVVHYFHVELDAHDILLADGMPAESYLDTGNRDQFSNAERVVALHPDFAAKRVQTDGCLPFVADGPRLTQVRQRLHERILARGYTIDHDPQLMLVVSGRALHPSAVEGRVYRFALPAGAREARLVSRTGIPSGTSPEAADSRRLGICVAGLTLHAPTGESRSIPLDDPSLSAGFHELESNGAEAWRWTDGDATVPGALLDDLGGELEIRLLWQGAYWTAPAPMAFAQRSA